MSGFVEAIVGENGSKVEGIKDHLLAVVGGEKQISTLSTSSSKEGRYCSSTSSSNNDTDSSQSPKKGESHSISVTIQRIIDRYKTTANEIRKVDVDLMKFTQKFRSYREYTDGDNSLDKKELSIAFIARLVDNYNPSTTFGPCRGLLLAVARVFGLYWQHISAARWTSLFTHYHDPALYNPLVNLISEVFFTHYDYRLVDKELDYEKLYGYRRPYTSRNRYKDIKDRLHSIGTSNTWPREIFARFLMHLCDALHGCRSAKKRRDVLGNLICHIGKLSDTFPEHDTWKKPLLVPSDLRYCFLDVFECDTDDDLLGLDDNNEKHVPHKHVDKVSSVCFCHLENAVNALSQLKKTKKIHNNQEASILAQLNHLTNKIIEIDRKIVLIQREIKGEKKQITSLEKHTTVRTKPRDNKIIGDSEQVFLVNKYRFSNRSHRARHDATEGDKLKRPFWTTGTGSQNDVGEPGKRRKSETLSSYPSTLSTLPSGGDCSTANMMPNHNSEEIVVIKCNGDNKTITGIPYLGLVTAVDPLSLV